MNIIKINSISNSKIYYSIHFHLLLMIFSIKCLKIFFISWNFLNILSFISQNNWNIKYIYYKSLTYIYNSIIVFNVYLMI